MVERADLEAAASAGVISEAQVAPLHSFLAERLAVPAARAKAVIAPTGEEELRFIRNFHDVFLSIGIGIFAIGMVIGGISLLNGADVFEPGLHASAWPAAALFVVCAAVQWGLAEIFAKRRRLFLPSIVLCLFFLLFGTLATAMILGEVVLRPFFESMADQITTANGANPPLPVRVSLLIGALATVAFTGLFWLRFRLPFALGQMGFCAALSGLVLVFVLAPESVVQTLPWWSLVAGAVLFMVGVWFDAQDPERRTLASDNGFWLHFAAAPLILNGTLALTAGTGFWHQMLGVSDYNAMEGKAVGAALVTLLVVFALGTLSLLINRRALIVSALLTTGIAIGVLVNALGLDFGGFAAVTLLLLGGSVLLLGAGWHTVRRALLGWVKPDGFWARIFPPEGAPE